MDDLERLLRRHPFLEGLSPEHLGIVLGCVANCRFSPGSYLAREGDDEAHVYLIREGTVSIETNVPGEGPVTLETLTGGDVLGISWLAPARAHFDCVARDTVLALSVDGECLKRKMDADSSLGYALTRRLLARTYDRLSRARLQKLDLYR